MALVVTTWLWGDKYSPDYVRKLAAGVKRNLSQSHRFVCITDKPDLNLDGVDVWPLPEQDEHLTQIKGCFARLRLFDPTWQAVHAIGREDRIVNMDLDAVVTGPLDPLVDRLEPFVILQGANAANPCPYNGSVFLLRAGAHPEVWGEFSLARAGKVPFHEFPDDQGWFWHVLPNAAGWRVGQESGVYAFQKPGWPDGPPTLPKGARLVAFPGWRDPAQFAHLPWVAEHWR